MHEDKYQIFLFVPFVFFVIFVVKTIYMQNKCYYV